MLPGSGIKNVHMKFEIKIPIRWTRWRHRQASSQYIIPPPPPPPHAPPIAGNNPMLTYHMYFSRNIPEDNHSVFQSIFIFPVTLSPLIEAECQIYVLVN